MFFSLVANIFEIFCAQKPYGQAQEPAWPSVIDMRTYKYAEWKRWVMRHPEKSVVLRYEDLATNFSGVLTDLRHRYCIPCKSSYTPVDGHYKFLTENKAMHHSVANEERSLMRYWETEKGSWERAVSRLDCKLEASFGYLQCDRAAQHGNMSAPATWAPAVRAPAMGAPAMRAPAMSRAKAMAMSRAKAMAKKAPAKYAPAKKLPAKKATVATKHAQRSL